MFPLTESFNLSEPLHGKMIEETATLGTIEVARVRSTGHRIALQENERLTFLFPRAGRLEVETSGRSMGAKAQSALLFAPNRRSTWAHAEGATNFEASVLLISQTAILEEARRVGMRTLRAGVECHFESSRPSHAFFGLQRYLGYLIEELARPESLLERRKVAAAASGLAVEQLLSVLSDCGALEDMDSKASASNAQVNAAEAYMRQYYPTIGSMNEVAQAVGIGVRCLQTSFRTARGTTPRETLVRIRLECAREALLRSTEGSTVTAVAQECGFTHFGRFSAQYRQAFNESPSATLKRVLERP